VTVKHLSSRSIEDIPLPLPPLDEQRSIVAEIEKQFSRLDEAVANLQRVRARLSVYRSSVEGAAATLADRAQRVARPRARQPAEPLPDADAEGRRLATPVSTSS